ncbi:Autophagy-related protein 5 [Penicillium cf. griseofulvum]|nr:Autophagy-related protein 5 [Penicillium cf. griseofulvum]
MDNRVSLGSIQKAVWDGRLPLEIVLASSESRTFDKTDPYLIAYPRISYLPSLLPKLRAFFSSFLIEPNSQSHDGWFEFEGVPLKWHYPVGLLFDLYAGADPASKTARDNESPDNGASLPWRLIVHFSDWPHDLVRLDADGMVMNDAFINSVKEADFLRNGTAKGIMSLSKEDSSGLWNAVQELFFPESGTIATSSFNTSIEYAVKSNVELAERSNTQPQTIGTVLHTLLPNLFPSRRTPVLAKPVLHGAVVPMSAPIEEVVRSSAYGDGWAYLVIRMMG